MTHRRRILWALAAPTELLCAFGLSCAVSCGNTAAPAPSASGGGNVGGAAGSATIQGGTAATGGVSGANGAGGTAAPGAGGSPISGGMTAGASVASTGGNTANGAGATAGGNAATGGSTSTGGTPGSTAGASGGFGAAGQAGGVTTGGNGGSATAGTCPGTTTLAPGETTQTITVGGTARTYIRHVPPSYTGKMPVPVVIDFHPLGGSASSWKGSTGWSALADKQGFIMIWPNGVENSWNAGRCCRAAMEQKIDDVGLAKAIVGALKKDGCIDAKRVYATGCSNGGAMAYRVACDAADVFAAVAPVDFDCVTNSADKPSCGMCTPARPISEIQFRGTADSAVPYEGGKHDGGTTEHPGALENFADWGQINACTGTPQALPSHASCQAYPMCGGGVQTALCTVQNGMHCGNYQSFKIVDIAWETFQEHTLP